MVNGEGMKTSGEGTGEGVEAFGDFGCSGGADGGEDVFDEGKIAGAGVEISGAAGVASSGSGLTEGTSDLKVCVVATGNSESSLGRNERVDSDQLIDGLKR